MKALAFSLASLVLVAAACSGAESIDDHACPPGGTTLTYENFGKDFMDAHCVRCHGGPNGYSSRAFTSVDNIRVQRRRIYANAAGDNTFMPPGPDDPPRSDRDKLANWLACGAP